MVSVPALGHAEPGPDLRVALQGVFAWAGGLLALLSPGWALSAALAGLAAAAAVRSRRGQGRVLLGCLLAAAAVAAVATLRVAAYQASPVARLAEEGAVVTLRARVGSDAVSRPGRFGDMVLVRLRVERVVGRGRAHETRVPVLVVADGSWSRVRLGDRIHATGRLRPAERGDLAAVLLAGRAPTVIEPPNRLLTGAAAVRAGIRAAVAGAAPDPRALVPALVDGDDQAMSEQVVADFRTTGLTHLAAVSGTNLTLVVGFALVLARALGVRARGLLVVGVLGVAGFVLLARPEPSVLRAAAMGSVGLLGMGSASRQTGMRALGVALLVLLLVDPWLSVSVGFALSTLATAGILLLGPPFRDALATWLPRWAAEAIAVPFAAQLACTPIVAALSGQVSLVAVAANLLAAAAVGPATVLGLVGGLAMLLVPPVGLLVGRLAGWCAGWIIGVAVHLARLPAAAVDWPAGPVAITTLGLVCLGIGLGAHRVLRRRWLSVGVAAVLTVVMTRPLPDLGWPPPGWVLVACDVGQGDGLVLNAGRRRGVVVDVGPDGEAMDRCLDRLRVQRVPVAVLTHFHADHVGGLPAVLAGRPVGEVDVTGTPDPEYGAREVRHWTARAGVQMRVPAYGETRRLGELTWQVVGPARTVSSPSAREEGSVANNASLVLLVRVRGVRILMGGDMEPEAQAALHRAIPDLRVDVLKVPHHGSRYQEEGLLSGLTARLAVVSVGAHNDYGHPAWATLRMLRDAGMSIRRTDLAGDVAVVVDDGRLRTTSRGR